MRNFTQRWPQSGHFSSKLGQFFQIFEKGQGRPPPVPPLDTRLGHKWFMTHIVLTFYRSMMGIMYMYSRKQCVLPAIPIMALWQLMHLGTWCAVIHTYINKSINISLYIYTYIFVTFKMKRLPGKKRNKK